MSTDYNFYTEIYKGNKLDEDNFDRFSEQAENIIASYTFNRINNHSLPQSLVLKVKKCTCELAEYLLELDKINNAVSVDDSGNFGVVRHISAGQVSKTYDTSSIRNFFNRGEESNRNKAIKLILNKWLYPQYIGEQYYNLLSWVG